jgi:putative hydrolase of the HAD superfamily
MQNTRAICFDLFSTLISVGQVPETVGAFTADILGVDRKRWNEACFGPLHEIRKPSQHLDNLRRMALSLDSSIPEQRIQEATAARQARFDHALEHGVEDQVLESLGSLKQAGFKLALISNASSPEVQAWQYSPLAGYFDVTVFSCETGFCKPESDIYHYTLEQLEEDAGDCLFIGDGGSEEHLGAARVGMIPILLSHYLDEQETRQRLNKYQGVLHRHIETMDELLAILNLKLPEK